MECFFIFIYQGYWSASRSCSRNMSSPCTNRDSWSHHNLSPRQTELSNKQGLHRILKNLAGVGWGHSYVHLTNVVWQKSTRRDPQVPFLAVLRWSTRRVFESYYPIKKQRERTPRIATPVWAQRVYVIIMLLSNFGDENRGLSPVWETGFRIFGCNSQVEFAETKKIYIY